MSRGLRKSFLTFWALATLGCTGDANNLAPTSSVDWEGEGFFVGTIAIDGVGRRVEALLTYDGVVRMYIDDTASDPIPHSAQFLGTLNLSSTDLSAGGVLVGQGCTDYPENPLCGHATPAHVTLKPGDYHLLSGEIAFAGPNGDETWTFYMNWETGGYLMPASLAKTAGVYSWVNAEFSHDLDTVVSIDTDGRAFFQSPNSRCVGNGNVRPYGDGAKLVYAVTLTIEVCDGPYALLNGNYEGVATYVYGGFADDFAEWLLVWLATPECTEAACQALTFWAFHS
jgi:hypothetical protein